MKNGWEGRGKEGKEKEGKGQDGTGREGKGREGKGGFESSDHGKVPPPQPLRAFFKLLCCPFVVRLLQPAYSPDAQLSYVFEHLLHAVLIVLLHCAIFAGHPIGATGLAQAAELNWQVRKQSV